VKKRRSIRCGTGSPQDLSGFIPPAQARGTGCHHIRGTSVLTGRVGEGISPSPLRAAQSREGGAASRSCPGKTHGAAGSAAEKGKHPGVLAEFGAPSVVCTRIFRGCYCKAHSNPLPSLPVGNAGHRRAPALSCLRLSLPSWETN